MEENIKTFKFTIGKNVDNDSRQEIITCFQKVDSVKELIIVEDLLQIKAKQDQCTIDTLVNIIEILRFKVERIGDEVSIVGKELFKCHVRIQGMTCSSCVHSIEGQVSRLIGVKSILINLLSTMGEVIYDPDLVNPSQIVEKINDMGFDAEPIQVKEISQATIETTIQGMTCASCVHNIQNRITKIPGILSVKIALPTESGLFKYDPRVISPRDIIDAIEDMGFGASLATKKSADTFNSHIEEGILKWRHSFIVSLIFGIPTMVVMMVFMFAFGHSSDVHNMTSMMPSRLMLAKGLSWENALLFTFSTPVQFYGARYFYIQAWKSVKHGTANMDVLVVMSTSVAYTYSVIVLIVSISLRRLDSPQTFFETTPMLIVFLTLGRWLEHIAKGKTSEALSKLLSLQAYEATIITEDNSERRVPIELVKKGDLIKILPGEKVPADGRVISGNSNCDESLITGEAMPVEKHEGSDVIGGTMNITGMLIVRATLIGEDSALSQIVKLVEEAQMSKAPIQEFADKIAGIFVPGVLVCSFVTLITWVTIGYYRPDLLPGNNILSSKNTETAWKYAFQLAITVLSIACPCSLGLATPTAVMVGTGVGALNGILIKGGLPLEKMHQLDVIVFDKTGTITEGQPSVCQVLPCVENATDEIINSIYLILGAAESSSEHPIGKSILKYVQGICSTSNLPTVTESKAISGFGLECTVLLQREMFSPPSVQVENLIDLVEDATPIIEDFHWKKLEMETKVKVCLGNRNLMKSNGVEVSRAINEAMNRDETVGRTVILMAVNGQLAAMVSVADQVKKEAPLAMYCLQKMGLEVFLLTGDNRKTAKSIAKEVGITNVFAEVLPSHKVAQIRHLQSLPRERKSILCFGTSKKKKMVAMVGDGINDSPALAQADIGIAIGTGTDVAVAAADVVLIRNSLLDVIAAIELSKATVRRIRQNFFAATIYNLLGIPIAAGVLLPIGIVFMPWMASIAMAASSICVVLLSLMLKLWKKPSEKTLSDRGFREYFQRCQSDDMEISVHLGKEIELPIPKQRRSFKDSINSFLSSLDFRKKTKKSKYDSIAMEDDNNVAFDNPQTSHSTNV